MRKRIVCLVLLAALALPAAGWAKGHVIDPDGQQLREGGSGFADVWSGAVDPPAGVAERRAGAATAAAASAASPAWLAPVHRFLAWLGTWYGPL